MSRTMSTTLAAPADDESRRHRFGRVLRAEWTKFRTVRGWVLGLAGALVSVVLVGLLGTAGGARSGGNAPELPVGPSGEAVNDSFSFLHRPLRGDGSLTVEVASLTGRIAASPTRDRPGLAPWAKAGIIVKDSLRPGSSYAALMVTGDHGVRMQHDYTHDTAGGRGGATGTAPQLLRLVRSGDTVTGYRSADGSAWELVGSARLPGLSATVRAGLFATSPSATEDTGTGTGFAPAVATGTFGTPVLSGGRPGDAWRYTRVGRDAGTSGSYTATAKGAATATATGYRITGAGDIAPVVGGPSAAGVRTVTDFLVGGFAGLIVIVVVATGYMTSEYRRGLIDVTFAATPSRGRVLAAKALVVGGAAFVVGTAAAAVVVPLGAVLSRAGGFPVLTVTPATEARAVLGTGLLLAAAATLALAAGAVLRRGAAAVTAVVAGTVLPYLLSTASLLPSSAADWLLRATPAAGFAVQQTVARYDQVVTVRSPANGYFPLLPWAGFAVLCAYVATAFVAALFLVRRRDA